MSKNKRKDVKRKMNQEKTNKIENRERPKELSTLFLNCQIHSLYAKNKKQKTKKNPSVSSIVNSNYPRVSPSGTPLAEEAISNSFGCEREESEDENTPLFFNVARVCWVWETKGRG